MAIANSEFSEEIEWSEWHPVLPTKELGGVCRGPGIMRISHTDVSGIHFVGHARTNLQQRVRRLGYELRNSEMPYSDPFSAAPCLWAMKNEVGGRFFVSWCSATDADQAKLLEDIYITLYRRATSQSPTANFGRMYSSYSKSTNKEAGVQGAKGASPPRNSPIGSEKLDLSEIQPVTGENWLGVSWEGPMELFPDELAGLSYSFPKESGIFRVWKQGENVLEAVGTANRLESGLPEAAPDDEEDMRVSFQTIDFESRGERAEMESILAGVHYLATEASTTVVHNDKHEIRTLIKEGETEETEFKGSIPGQANDIVRDLLAIANTKGGQLLIGVTDEGEIVGVNDIHSIKERVSDLINGNARTRIPADYQDFTFDEKDVLVVRIDPAQNHPFAFKDGQFSRREGPQRVKMYGSELEDWFPQVG